MFYNQNYYDSLDNRMDVYNYNNNNYNQPLYTETSKTAKLYDPYQGFIRGNMFQDLYNDYNFKKIEIVPLNEQAKMLTTLNSLDFAAHDLQLYLDLHPDDREMLELFNNYRNQANEMRNQYENAYGPLLVSSNATNKYPWSWDNNPWPWENKET